VALLLMVCGTAALAGVRAAARVYTCQQEQYLNTPRLFGEMEKKADDS